MNYHLEFKSDAIKFLHKQTKNQQIRIINAINHLPNGDIKKMIGLNGKKLYRLRIR